MSVKVLSGWFAAALVCTVTVAAQTPPQQQPPSPSASASAAQSTITVAGCVQKESDVVKRNPAATNMGMGDEFVLTQAALNPAPTPAEAKADAPTGTSGAASGPGKVFRVTGEKETELKTYVGQRVEITGAFKNEADAKRELGQAGGAPAATELTADKAPEITIVSIKPASGSCAPSAIR